MKKTYVSPQLDILILEQSDIITNSGNAESGSPGTGGGGNGGIFDGDWE
jgi:hypothetical protein